MCVFFFFFKQKTAYEMRISDWSSDVCSSDLRGRFCLGRLIAITDSLAVIFREQQIHALQKVVTLEPYVQIPILEDANAEIVALDHGWQRSAHACRIGNL